MEVRYRVQTDEVDVRMTGDDVRRLMDVLARATKTQTLATWYMNLRAGLDNALTQIEHYKSQPRKKAKEIDLPIVDSPREEA